MSRTLLPFHAPDISALARSLSSQLDGYDHKPSHVEILNMLVRGTGHRNFQQFRAQITAHEASPVLVLPTATATPTAIPVDVARLRKLQRLFDDQGRLSRWPSRQSHQLLCLWVIWSRIPAGGCFNEKSINELLQSLHLFGDHALLRRWLCDYDMMFRTVDGREYRRIEQPPPDDAIALIRLLS